jgi:Tol biopolymer transport system component
MGEVYRARDPRLKRDVALKILPPSFAADSDRLARFEREAQALAALNHPNIAAIYGFEEGPRQGPSTGSGQASVRALVLELVEGETLAERIARGAIPVAEALPIARQIAAALEAAHEQGIVHRDLKPANIKITPGGVVKVLDFGLAKLTGAFDDGSSPGVNRPASSSSLAPTIAASMSPTVPALMTGAGVMLGTAAYMSPEQARGKASDKRADIWAFGVVVYEMLTGSRAFGGDSVTETAGAVIHKELDWTALPADVPPAARTVLRRCLQKDPTQRIRDIGDARLALDGAFTPDTAAQVPARSAGTGRRITEIAAAALVAAALAGVGVWLWTRPQPETRFPVRLDVSIASRLAPFVGLSPDGRQIAVVGGDDLQRDPKVLIYSFETGQARTLDNAGAVRTPPFWSPDGRSIAFVGDGKLKRIDVAGGPADTLTDIKNFGGGTWTRDNVIVYADTAAGGLFEIPAGGGAPKQITKGIDVFPSVLPDGQHFLYTRLTPSTSSIQVFVGTLGTALDKQNATPLVTTTRGAAYAPSPGNGGTGHILFVRDALLMAQAFDERSLTLAGDAVPLIDSVRGTNLIGSFAVSANGTLAYMKGESETGSLVWVGRDGQPGATIATNLKGVRNPRLSPDGKTLAAVVGGHVWAYDLGGRPPIRLTFSGDHHSPLFIQDGRRIVYESADPLALLSVPSDGSGGAPEQVGPIGHFHPQAWSADRGEIVINRLPTDNTSATSDLVKFVPRKDAEVVTVVETPAQEGSASLSPDGRWLAYSSDSTGTGEIWVRPFPGPGAPVRVSPNGGGEPLWSHNGRELYYMQGANIMAMQVETGKEFNFKPPTRLFENTYQRSQQAPNYAVAADGRFVMIKPDSEAGSAVSVILNWQELLRQKNVTH